GAGDGGLVLLGLGGAVAAAVARRGGLLGAAREPRLVGTAEHDRLDRRPRPADLDEALHLLAVDRLVLHERTSDEVEAVAVVAQHGAAPVLLLAQDLLDLLVDHTRRLVGVVARVHEVLAEEHLTLRAPRHRPDARAHAPLPHHFASELGRHHEVVVGTGGDDAVHRLLRDAPAHGDDETVLDVVLAVDVALLDRELLRHAERHAGR